MMTDTTNSFVSGNLVISTWRNPTANQLAFSALKSEDKSLLDAVEVGINTVEDDPKDQSVGYGGRPDKNGEVTLDACIMDSKGNVGSVTYLKEIKHAISVARLVLETTPHVILSGQGAQDFALENGYIKENLLTEKSKLEYDEWAKEMKYEPKANIERHDTIGLLVKDAQGNLSGGCSTSGMAYKLGGRVGDSPIPGAGLFVDNEIGACTATGVGELVLKTCASFLCVEFMRSGLSPQAACEKAIMRIIDKIGAEKQQVGLICCNKKGQIGAYSIMSGFVYSVTDNDSTQILEAYSYSL